MGRKKTISEAIKPQQAQLAEIAAEEAREDYSGHCAASEAIAEHLVSVEIRPFDGFAKELWI